LACASRLITSSLAALLRANSLAKRQRVCPQQGSQRRGDQPAGAGQPAHPFYHFAPAEPGAGGNLPEYRDGGDNQNRARAKRYERNCVRPMLPMLAGIDTLWHCSSFTSPWGTQQAFDLANVRATRRSIPASITLACEETSSVKSAGMNSAPILLRSLPIDRAQRSDG
jgi:hypothetical protein